MDELIIVDETDKVLGKADTNKVHKNRLLHRSVHIFIINPEKKLLCRKIQKTSSLYAGYWSTGIGVHVLSGTSYDLTAKKAIENNREISSPLVLLGKIRIEDGVENEISAVYISFSDLPIVIDKSKADEARFFSEKEIRNMLSREHCTPHLALSLQLYVSKKGSIAKTHY
jgi:isopentenyldiphosphate isomerase